MISQYIGTSEWSWSGDEEPAAGCTAVGEARALVSPLPIWSDIRDPWLTLAPARRSFGPVMGAARLRHSQLWLPGPD